MAGRVSADFRSGCDYTQRALFATALAQALVVVIALIIGKHRVEVSSVAEIVLLNGFFVALFLGSAWLFRKAAPRRIPAGAGPEG